MRGSRRGVPDRNAASASALNCMARSLKCMFMSCLKVSKIRKMKALPPGHGLLPLSDVSKQDLIPVTSVHPSDLYTLIYTTLEFHILSTLQIRKLKPGTCALLAVTVLSQ